MPVSQSLGLGDKLREALAEAQNVLSSTDLRGKVKLEVTTAGGASASDVESAIDRTEADAKDAAKTGGGGTAVGVVEGPLSPSNKLIDAMEKLIKAMDGVPDAIDKPSGGRRGRRTGGTAPGEDEAGAPGYMNPYLLQGLVQNPLGTMRGMGTSMLMGGSGMGMKPPGWMNETLGGSSGMFSVGRALGAQTLGGAEGAAAYMAPGAIAAAGLGTFVAALVETFKVEQHIAADRAKDAEGRVSDYRMGNAAGFDFRASTWRDPFQSRSDIDMKDIKEMVQASGVGFGGLVARKGSWQAMGGWESGTTTGLQSVINTGLNVGVSPGQMGSMLGAGTRSGTLDVNAANGTEQLLRWLGLIEQWTKKASEYGLSTSEALSSMASDSQQQASGAHGLVTDSATRQMLSLRGNLEKAGFDRPGVQSMSDALGAAPRSDVERVLEMNEFLGNDEQLTPQGKQWAVAALGADRVAAMEKEFGPAAGTMIANAAMNTKSGATKGRASMAQKMRRNGASPMAVAMYAYGGDTVMSTQGGTMGGERTALEPDIFNEREGGQEGRGRSFSGGENAAVRGIQGEIDLRRADSVQTALSGVQGQWAASVIASANVIKDSNRKLVDALTRLGDKFESGGGMRSYR